jgi:glucose/arabinose dehydrogenase
MWTARVLGGVALASALVVGDALAVDPPLTSTSIATGFTRALFATAAPGDTSRLFVVEQTGKIKIVNLATNTVNATPFLDLTSLVSTSSGYLEYGVLGLAFDLNYASNGVFYVTYTPGTTNLADFVIARYRVSAGNPNVADAASGAVVLKMTYDIKQHRAGWIGFGPDGYLYATTGDGGENDPFNAAATIVATSPYALRGKVLRLDVTGPDGIPGTSDDDDFPSDANKNYRVPPTNPFVGTSNAPEIWAYGLRNPWRASFDRATGDLYIGDVGQSTREEIDILRAGTSGVNFGWRCKEGNFSSSFAECTGTLPPSQAPALDYPRSSTTSMSGGSVTGGYVYRGCAMPGLQGTYFFADWTSGKVFSFRSVGGAVTALTNRLPELSPTNATTISSITSFGEDARGELYYVQGGTLWKIVPRTPGADRNHNGVVDTCESDFCLADMVGLGGVAQRDHVVSADDLIAYLAGFFAQNANVADISGVGGTPAPDGQITVDDLIDYLAAFFVGCP